MIKRVGFFLICILLMTNGILIFLPTTVQADISYPNELQIFFFPGEEEQIADVRPGEPGTALFRGEIVTAIRNDYDFDYFNVILYGKTNLKWPVLVEPQMTVMGLKNTTKFTATVHVPAEMSTYISDTVTVYGYAIGHPGNITGFFQPETGSVKIAQYSRINLECENALNSIVAGDKAIYDLTIWNYGNGKDTATLYVENIKKLISEDIDVKLNTYTTEVDEKSQKTVSIKISTSWNCDPGIYKIKLAVVEESSEVSNFEPELILYLNIESYIYQWKIFFVLPLIITGIIIISYVSKRKRTKPSIYVKRKHLKNKSR